MCYKVSLDSNFIICNLILVRKLKLQHYLNNFCMCVSFSLKHPLIRKKSPCDSFTRMGKAYDFKPSPLPFLLWLIHNEGY